MSLATKLLWNICASVYISFLIFIFNAIDLWGCFWVCSRGSHSSPWQNLCTKAALAAPSDLSFSFLALSLCSLPVHSTGFASTVLACVLAWIHFLCFHWFSIFLHRLSEDLNSMTNTQKLVKNFFNSLSACPERRRLSFWGIKIWDMPFSSQATGPFLCSIHNLQSNRGRL